MRGTKDIRKVFLIDLELNEELHELVKRYSAAQDEDVTEAYILRKALHQLYLKDIENKI